jgi:ABC-2 type transport system ATP-binding protein
MSIKVQSLSKIFGKQRAVDQISFEARPGEILGFLGPNGAGKSTTMKIATAYLPPTEGLVEVCGIDVQEDPLAVRKKIGYLPEHNPLYLDMYVHEYLHFCGSLHLGNTRTLRQKVSDVVDRCGLGLEQNKKIGALSKGYRQRVGLAQALLHQPDVLILDEPTTGLDPNQILEIRKLIQQESRDKTVIFSTHIMQEVQALCDRVVIINRGKIVADGIPAELSSLMKGRRYFIVEFKEALSPDILESIDGAEKVEPAGKHAWKISTSGDRDLREQIFAFANQHQYTLLGLRQEESNMEDIFRELTQNTSAQ